MRLIYSKSKWEMWDDSVESFVKKAAGDGFEATEIYLDTVREDPGEVAAVHNEHGVELIGQILTAGSSPDEHISSLERQFERAVECRPVAINLHAGRDIFDFDSNVSIFTRVIDLGRQMGIPVCVETHRGRPTYSAVETTRFLNALPDLRLTADFSHWMVVHESDLTDQPVNVDRAIERTDHIHARVGYEEGPQITDPRAPEWQRHVRRHLDLWQRVVDHHLNAGSARLTITPEFGPPTYMHTLPHTNMPVADVWETNVYMKRLLSDWLRLDTVEAQGQRPEGVLPGGHRSDAYDG